MEMNTKIEKICSMMECLMTFTDAAITSGLDKADARELGEAVDMIKDLAEAEKYIRESKYYETVTEAMEQGGEPEERYGYNRNRYASGRYAPSGHGNMTRGYSPMKSIKPMVDQMPYVDEYLHDGDFMENMRMGYHDGMMDSGMNHRYGRSYNDYMNARKHYTASKSQEDKDDMTRHANEHMADTLATMRDIWKTAEPDQRKRMKADLSALVAEMAV